MSNKKVHVSYDQYSGELLVNWDHATAGIYEAIDQEDGPIWVSIKRCVDTGRIIGVMVENIESIAAPPHGIRDFIFETMADDYEDDEM